MAAVRVVSEVPLASGKGDLFEAFVRVLPFRFMPLWLQLTVLGAIVAIVVTAWSIMRTRKIAARRAAREKADMTADVTVGVKPEG
ncbi:hypothetical protein AB0I94_24340 [Streptomyces sp. NPDC050147]|uniref:hypothetical protein n=1 Tax=Streptomyces sp. NPDC050147 TaxID=3155513 RepID=UPI00342C4660